MGFSFDFCFRRRLGRERIVRARPKTRHYKNPAFTGTRLNAYGRQTGCVNAQENANRNGFVSRYELLAAFHDRLAAMVYFCGVSAGRHP